MDDEIDIVSCEESEKSDFGVIKYFEFGKIIGDAEIIAKTEKQIGYPCLVKPNDCDISMGISMARNIHELRQGILKAFRHADSIIIEEVVHFEQKPTPGSPSSRG